MSVPHAQKTSHLKTEGPTKTPNNESGTQTGPANPEHTPSSADPSPVRIKELILSSMPPTTPRCQTASMVTSPNMRFPQKPMERETPPTIVLERGIRHPRPPPVMASLPVGPPSPPHYGPPHLTDQAIRRGETAVRRHHH
jgi:hypothetical protein